jgi:nicotinate-nucleotide pyrophosphorylase
MVAALAQADAARALDEDLGAGDLTAGLVDPARQARARVLAREPAVICGAPWAQATLDVLAPGAQITWHVAEGQRCQADQVVFEVQAAARALLSAERTMLNFLQLLSAVATKTAVYVDAVKGTRAQIVDTRKTLPGLRLAQKYAVRTGGGTNTASACMTRYSSRKTTSPLPAASRRCCRRRRAWPARRASSRSRSRRWTNCARRWTRVPAWCCWTT